MPRRDHEIAFCWLSLLDRQRGFIYIQRKEKAIRHPKMTYLLVMWCWTLAGAEVCGPALEMDSAKQCRELAQQAYNARVATLQSYRLKIAGGRWECVAL